MKNYLNPEAVIYFKTLSILSSVACSNGELLEKAAKVVPPESEFATIANLALENYTKYKGRNPFNKTGLPDHLVCLIDIGYSNHSLSAVFDLIVEYIKCSLIK